ncbi:hypothetical protein FOZ60_000321 [Perkinsus olseni]|uniref:Uncharacterized protein n=1 Tax=Perkinsus olseni TaxID=32597 RepID=A0A7J6P4T2_PEROL|nr:hypothetical protein FOZ60_000321 [Perkinsus olseni]
MEGRLSSVKRPPPVAVPSGISGQGPVESSSITSTASQPRTPDRRPRVIEETIASRDASQLRELLLVYRRDLRVLRNQLGAVMEENDELRRDLKAERQVNGELSDKCERMRQEVSSMQDTLESERVTHLCRLIQWRGAVSIRNPLLLLDMARRRYATTVNTTDDYDENGLRAATWKMSLGPVSLRITLTSEYSLSSSAAAYFSTELGLGGMPGSGASLLSAVANIKLKGWVQRNKGGYWDRWKWCFAVFISNDGSNCSRLSLWRTDRDFEDRLWDFDTSANMSMADEAEWKRLAVNDDESINANPQLKWDERSYPVGLKATPHPKVGGSSHLDEKIDKMMPSLQPLPFAFDEMLFSCLFLTLLAPTSCLVSVAPDKVVRDPLPLPTSTGVTQKKPMAPTIDGVRVDLGKPVDYGALIGPSRTVPAGPPPPPSVFEKPDLSWSPRLNTTIATYSITAAVPVRSRGLEGWLPKRGSLTRLQEETPSTFTSTTVEEDTSTERKLKKIIADYDD